MVDGFQEILPVTLDIWEHYVNHVIYMVLGGNNIV